MVIKRALQRLRGFRADDGGAAALEFAIVASVFVISAMGIFEFGRSLQVRNEMAYAMDWGAREVLKNANASEDQIKDAIKARFDHYDQDNLVISAPVQTIACTDDGTPDTMDVRAVSVSYPLKIFIPGYSGTFDIALERFVPISDC